VAAAVAEALIGLLALRLACLSATGVLGFVGLIVAAFVVMSWYCGLGLEYQFEVTALFLGWLALMISGVLLALVFHRDPLQTRATDHEGEGEEGERQSHRQETDKHKQRLLPLSRLLDGVTHRPVRVENDPVRLPIRHTYRLTPIRLAHDIPPGGKQGSGSQRFGADRGVSCGRRLRAEALATAVAQLAEAVEEFAKTMHRESS
jgi:hypothetical protein